MPPLLDFALSMSRPAPEPVIVREARRKPLRPPEERKRHEAGDHSLCDPQRAAHGVCSQCGRTIAVSRSSTAPERRRCRACQRSNGHSELLTLTCANVKCGREFTRKAYTLANDHPCCSQSCSTKVAIQRGLMPNSLPRIPGVDRATRRSARARARHLRHAQTWDGIGDEEILQRDGWRCQIPGCKRRPIRQDVKFPHPRSRSIDHIIPLSLGGDDTAENKRAAHLACNMARGNKMAEEQLPLFGSVREAPLATVTAGERVIMFGRIKRRCACGELPLKSSKFCQDCIDRRQAAAEDRRALRLTCRVRYYTCRYCEEVKVERVGSASPREVCPARACQLARLTANNLRLRHGMTAEEADVQVRVQVRWRRGAAA